MANITCPITLHSQVVVLSQSPDNRTVEVVVGSTEQVISAVISQGRKGDKGDPGAPGGVNAISAGGVSTSGGTLVFGNSNGVSFGLSDGTLTASHGGLTTAAQVSHLHGSPTLMLQDITGGVSSASDGLTIALTGPQLTYSQFEFANGNGLTFGTSGSTVTASVNAGLTTAPALDHTHGGVPTLALTNMFGTASSASGGLTLSLSVDPSGTGTGGGSADGYNIIGVNGSTVHSAATVQFSNSNNVSFGLAGSTVTASASYPAQTAFVLSDSNGMSFGTSGSTVTAQAPAQTEYIFSQGGGLTFGTSGSTITASHDGAVSNHSHGNPTLALTNLSGSTASGSNGLTISLAGQDLPVDGGIALRAGTQTAQSGTVVFSNANGITFGMSGSSRVTASHNGLTTAALSDHSHGLYMLGTGVSVSTTADSGGQSILLSVSNPLASTLYYSAVNGSASIGTLKFADSNGVSFSTGTQGLFATVKTDYAASDAAVHTSQSSLFQHTSATSAITSQAMNTSERGRYFYTSANTFANSTHSHGAISVAGLSATSASGGLTLSVSQTVQTQGSVQVGGSTGAITFANSNGITFGGNASTITASHNGLTTAAQSDHSHGNPTLALTNMSGTTASASNGLTISLSAPTTVPVVALSAGAQVATSGTVRFSNANGISFGMSGSTRITASHNALTTAMASNAGTGFMSTSERDNYFYTSNQTFANSNHSHGNPTLNLTNISGTTASNSAGLTISLSAGVGGGGGAAISAGTQSGNTGTIVFSNSNGISFGMSGNTRVTASVDAAAVAHSHGNPTLALTNLTGTTASASNGLTLSLSAAAPGLTTAAQVSHSHGNPTLALTNLTGTTASNSAGFTISLSGGAGSAAGGVALQNSETTFGTGTVSLAASGALTIGSGTGQRMLFSVPQTSSLVGANITVSTSGSTITLSALPTAPTMALTNLSATTASNSNGVTISLSAGGGAELGFESTENRPLADTTQSSLGQNSVWFAPFRVTGGTVNASTFRIAQSFTGTVTSAATAQWGQTIRWGLYTKINSTQYSSVSSGSFTMQIWNSGTSSNSWAYAGITSSSGASNQLVTEFMGLRYHQGTLNGTLTQGDYMFGVHQSTSSAGYSALVRTAGILCINPVGVAMGSIGQQTNNSIGIGQAGRYSATSAALPDTFGPSQLQVSLNVVPYVKIGAV